MNTFKDLVTYCEEIVYLYFILYTSTYIRIILLFVQLHVQQMDYYI